MSQTSTGTRGEPQFASSGNSPTFAADLSLLATFAAARSFRDFTTVALLAAATGSSAGEWAKADAAPGALYFFNATTGLWQLGNQPSVADQSHRDALFSGTLVPVQGNEIFRADLGHFEVYYALYNASTNPGGAKTAGWLPGGPGPMPGGIQVRSAAALTLAATYVVVPAAAFSEVLAGAQPSHGPQASFATNGGWVAPYDGIYDVDFHVTLNSSANIGIIVKKNDATASSIGEVLQGSGALTGSAVWGSVAGKVALAAGDILRVAIFCGAVPTINNSPDVMQFGFRWVEPRRA